MKRMPRITRTARAATVLIVFGAAVLTIVALGPVVAKGQHPTMIGDTTTDETGVASTSEHEGARLFRKETFGGNGRTCETCHSPSTGTRSPEDVQELLAENPNDPLFLHDGLDDGVSGTSRIAEHATIRVVRPAHLGADCGQWRGADHAELLSVDLSQLPGLVE